MNTIDTDFVRQKWQYKPEFSTADTTSFSTGSCVSATTSTSVVADEIDKRIKELYRRREIEMTGISFNDLEKDLKELGIVLSTIRYSSGEAGCEIEGYFSPSIYKKHNTHEKPTVSIITPKIKKDGKWFDLAPKKVIFSGPATIIFWKDGTKTVVKCQEEYEYFDEEKGIAMCYLKKLFGNNGNYNNIFRKAMKVSEVR